ncbi:MAG: LTA synthase family protein [Bacteroidales bacterium]|nr:LTA synthase family protein [Bacteroidales bacterium]MBR2228106.1 LTA synthase family protein [Bacteroidales bacterium]MBR4688486.1 LTA synthase family protein [Bacteroidales bacterium]
MRRHFSYLLAVVWNLFLAMAVYTVCRLVFFRLNQPLFPDIEPSRLFSLFRAGWRFDLSAVLFTNTPYLLLMLIPFRFREKKGYRLAAKGLYVVPNFLAYAIDLADAVYFPFTSRRTTCTVFQEFGGDDNLGKIFLQEAATHWYLVLLGLGILFLLIKAYREPAVSEKRYGWSGYLLHTALFVAALYPVVGGMRGGFGPTIRPIGINDANLYIEKPIESALVLNTAFSMYKTIDENRLKEVDWFQDEKELEAAFNPVIRPQTTGPMNKKNVVILILESFSASYSGYLTEIQGGRREGYMPFLDSLMQESLVFRHSFANGRLSIDALPSVMCGIPALVESFTLTPYANNDVRGLARELGECGYSSAFYHGAQRNSLALAGFAHKAGFQQEFSRESYGNEADFDGTWGIWDEPFLQYFKDGIGKLPEPFLATVFTLSSHHPFAVPEQYEGVFEPGTMPIHRCIRYSDHAIRRFFEEARKQPWYENTLFVITGDHTSRTDAPEYLTLNGVFTIPILFYTPDGSLKGLREGIAMQLDIKPTVLSYLGYDKPSVSFGCDLLSTADEDTYAINYQNGTYLYYRQGYQLQFDGEQSIALYHFTEDRLLEKNLLESDPARAADMEYRLKALIQQFNHRLIHNQLTAAEE